MDPCVAWTLAFLAISRTCAATWTFERPNLLLQSWIGLASWAALVLHLFLDTRMLIVLPRGRTREPATNFRALTRPHLPSSCFER